MTDPTNNPVDETTPIPYVHAEVSSSPRRRPEAVLPDAGPGAVPGAAALNGARRTGRDGRRRGARARHVAQQWPLPARRRGPLRRTLWGCWWVLVAVVAGASGALITLTVVALNWPH